MAALTEQMKKAWRSPVYKMVGLGSVDAYQISGLLGVKHGHKLDNRWTGV